MTAVCVPDLTPVLQKSPTFSWTQVRAMKISSPAVSSRAASASSAQTAVSEALYWYWLVCYLPRWLGWYSSMIRQNLESAGHSEGLGGCRLQ